MKGIITIEEREGKRKAGLIGLKKCFVRYRERTREEEECKCGFKKEAYVFVGNLLYDEWLSTIQDMFFHFGYLKPSKEKR